MNQLLKAPWANQSVGSFVRFLAWVFVVCGAFALTAGTYFSLAEDLPVTLPIEAIGLLLGSIYILALFLFVGIHGRAPSGWLPWR
jgi:ABC-type enterobactin transport system permease subunit